MNSILKWIWSGIKSVGKWTFKVFEAVWNVLSSLLTWVVAAVTYLVDTFWEWISSLLSSFASAVSQMFPQLDGLTIFNSSSLFGHFCQLFAIDQMFTTIGIAVTAFVIARLARLGMVPVRAVLEIV